MQEIDDNPLNQTDAEIGHSSAEKPVKLISDPTDEYKAAFDLTEAELAKVQIAQAVDMPAKASAEPASLNISFIGEGVCFKGAASLKDSCLVLGEVAGDLISDEDRVNDVSITVEVGGVVVGAISAGEVIIAGQIGGLIDAPGGYVDLKDTANVSGKVRYGKLQVSGAELNAKLERVVAGVVGQ